jgi:hypothetical protein
MIRAEQIPDEVVEAALPFSALCAYYCKPSANDCQCRQNLFRAIAAAINSWPDAGIEEYVNGDRGIFLPLPQEASDE